MCTVPVDLGIAGPVLPSFVCKQYKKYVRPSSAGVGTELAGVGTELTGVGTELAGVGTELSRGGDRTGRGGDSTVQYVTV